VGLERSPLSLVSTIEELLEKKVAAPVYKTENTAVRISYFDHVAPSRQRGRPSSTNPQLSKNNQREGEIGGGSQMGA
jgi:hypothetical protein